MDNCFQIGGIVYGNSFVGRKEMLSNYRKAYLDSNYRIGRALVGLTRTGKSSFAKNVFLNAPDDVLIISCNLKLCDNYYAFWKKICSEILKFLTKRMQLFGDIENNLQDIITLNEPEWIVFQENICDIFDDLKSFSIKTIIVIDEFDKAETLFEGKSHYWELLRTIFSEKQVSSLLISRHQIHEIEKSAYRDSTFFGVIETIPFKGFDDNDMNDYYNVFKENGVLLSDEHKIEIEYYAGRLPYLLSILGYYIIEAINNDSQIDIVKIFKEKCNAINDYYRDCIKYLEIDGDIKRMLPFVVGPNIGVTNKDRLELINLGYFRETEEKIVVISEYFRDFLTIDKLNISLWDNIINLEKTLKLLVEVTFPKIRVHYNVFGETNSAVFRNLLLKVYDINDSDIYRYDTYIQNNKKVFGIDSTYLDVMSLQDVVKLIADCWDDIYKQFFNNDLLSVWLPKFNKCAIARNPVAHGHENYLTDTERREIDVYCKQIFDILSNRLNFEILNGFQETEKDGEYIIDIPNFDYVTPVYDMIGERKKMYIIEVGNKNLRGVIDDKYKAVVTKNYLNNISLPELLYKKIDVIVERINNSQYEVRPIL